MTLSDGTTTLTLPTGLLWTDETDWMPLAIHTERALDGSLLYHSAPMTGGQPVTLSGPAWTTRADLLALLALLASYSGTPYTLTLDTGSTLPVAPAGPVRAQPVIDYQDPQDTDPVQIDTLPLLTVIVED